MEQTVQEDILNNETLLDARGVTFEQIGNFWEQIKPNFEPDIAVTRQQSPLKSWCTPLNSSLSVKDHYIQGSSYQTCRFCTDQKRNHCWIFFNKNDSLKEVTLSELVLHQITKHHYCLNGVLMNLLDVWEL